MNEDMVSKLKEAKSAEDVIAIAKEYGKEMTLEQAQVLLDRVKGAELSDDALGAVAGGGNDPISRRYGDVFKPIEVIIE